MSRIGKKPIWTTLKIKHQKLILTNCNTNDYNVKKAKKTQKTLDIAV